MLCYLIILQDKVEKFVDVLMATLGNARALIAEDLCALVDLYTGNVDALKVPPFTAKARGDKATDSLVLSTALACFNQVILFSLGEDVGT